MQTNKVYRVSTIHRVARELGKDPEWLAEIAGDMEPEDGQIWIYDLTDDAVMAFTDFGIENLRELIADQRNNTK